MTTFTTVSDLRLWVSERVGELETHDEVDQITDVIHGMDNFPNWGEDASEFLETLPDDLSKLLKPVFPDSIIFHFFDECRSFDFMKNEYKKWCKKNKIKFSRFEFQEIYDRVADQEIR